MFYGLTVTSSVADLDPHHIEKPDPHQRSQRPEPDPQQSQKPGAVEAHNRAMDDHLGAMEAHSGAEEAYIEPRRLFRPTVDIFHYFDENADPDSH